MESKETERKDITAKIPQHIVESRARMKKKGYEFLGYKKHSNAYVPHWRYKPVSRNKYNPDGTLKEDK